MRWVNSPSLPSGCSTGPCPARRCSHVAPTPISECEGPVSSVGGSQAALLPRTVMPQDHGPSETPASAACQGRRALSWACRLSASCRMTPVGCDAQQSVWSVVRPDPTPPLRSQCGVGRASQLSRNPEREVLGCQLLILSSKDVIGKKTNLPPSRSTNSEQAEGGLGDRQVGRPGRGSALVPQLALGWPGSPPLGTAR